MAVTLVVLAHASVPGLEGGFVGVDVFFVISGYVITGLLMRQTSGQIGRHLVDFYSRRVRRIVPAATVTLLATTIGAYVLLGRNFNEQLLGDVRWASAFAANFRLIRTGANYFVPGLAPSLITHYWSLGVEEQFYACIPLVVFTLAAIRSHRVSRAMLTVFFVVAIALSAWWSAHLSPLNPVQAYYSPLTRFWELALGGLVATLPPHWAERTPRANALWAFGAVAVGILAVAHLNATSVFPGWLAWWPCGATAVLLWTGRASSRGGPSSWLSWRPLVYVGDISYSIYLWHFPWLMLPLQMVHPATSDLARVIEVAGALTCAVFSYHVIENPIRHSRRFAEDRWAVLLLLLICVSASWDVTFVIGHLVGSR